MTPRSPISSDASSALPPPVEPPDAPRAEPPPADPDPRLTEPHLSCRMALTLVHYLADTFGADVAERWVTDAGLPLAYIRDTERWVSSAFLDRLLGGILQQLTGSTEVPPYEHPVWQHWRVSSRLGMRPEALGPLWYLVRSLGSPGLVYRQVPAFVRRANRLTQAEVLQAGAGHAVLRFAPRRAELPDQASFCWSRIGLLEAIPTVWGLPPATVEHHACLHARLHPARHCEYRVTYRERPLVRAVTAGLPAIGAAGLGLGAAALWAPTALGLGALVGGLAGLALEGWRRERLAVRRHREDSARLAGQIDEADGRYAELWDERRSLCQSLLVNRKISGYLAADLVEDIMRHPEMELTLGGVRTEAAVLFADIVGFTPRCESAPPEAVVDDLNLYFHHMDPVIVEHGGIIDKRIGDGIMVVFASRAGSEAPDALHRRAVGCGLGMLAALSACNAALTARGSPPLRIRIGIAAGPLVQGNMGSPAKLEYTVIGDVVNLAARLESNATPNHVLLERSLAAAVPAGATVASEREILVKGKSQPIRVVELRP